MIPQKRPPLNVWPSKKIKVPEISRKVSENVMLCGQGIILLTKDSHKMFDHSSRANCSPQEEAALLSCQLAFLAEAS